MIEFLIFLVVIAGIFFVVRQCFFKKYQPNKEQGTSQPLQNTSTQPIKEEQVLSEEKEEVISSTRTENHFYEWLQQNYGQKDSVKIYRDIYLPNFEVNAKTCDCNIDVALLSKKGILVFEIKESHTRFLIFQRENYKNNAEKPYKDYLIQIYKCTDKDTRETFFEAYFDNWFEQNEQHKRNLYSLIKQEQIADVPMRGIIVCYLTSNASILMDTSIIKKDNDFAYVPCNENNGNIVPKTISVLTSKVENFLKYQDKMSDETFAQLDALLSKYADASQAIKQQHMREMKDCVPCEKRKHSISSGNR